jgi:hypothetical protein
MVEKSNLPDNAYLGSLTPFDPAIGGTQGRPDLGKLPHHRDNHDNEKIREQGKARFM